MFFILFLKCIFLSFYFRGGPFSSTENFLMSFLLIAIVEQSVERGPVRVARRFGQGFLKGGFDK